MGADHSTEKSKNNNFTKAEVEKIIEKQRIIFEQKYKEILNTTKGVDEAFIAHQTREEARKEVERILKENRAQTSCPVSSPLSPVENLERHRTPYSLTQNDLKQTATYIYPNLIENNGNSNNNLPPQPASSQQYNYPPLFNGNTKVSSPNPTINHAHSSVVNSNNNPALANPSGSNPCSSNIYYNTNFSNRNPTVNNLQASGAISSPKHGFAQSNVGFNPITANSNTNPKVNLANNKNAGNVNYRKFEGHSNPVPSAPPASRDRSASRSRKNKAHGNAVEDKEFNCPTCKEKFTINIYQCSKGHSSCSNCRGRLASCGLCRLPITDIRNRALEQYIAERKIRCPNSKDGCCLFIKMAELETHAKECPFKDMDCPLAEIFGKCTWRGKLAQMAAHFNDVHPLHHQSTVGTEMSLLNFRCDNQVVHLVTIGSFNFLFQLKVSESNRMIYMTVQLIGTSHSADKWNYEIHIYDKNQPRKKYQYVDICHSNNSTLKDIIAQGKCAMIPFSYAETFLNDKRITYKFYIKRDNVENQNGAYGGARRRY